MSELFQHSFDSILVRLKVLKTKLVDNVLDMFRFHTGSIKSALLHPLLPLPQESFDSILVRLKVKMSKVADEFIKCFDSILVRLKANCLAR